MALIVQKFGGTSVASPEAREALVSKVKAEREDGNTVILVVSAMGRSGAPYATDTLLGLLGDLASGIGTDIDGRTADLMASCGETISACLVATLLSARGVPAIPMTAYTAGMHAEGPYRDASITGIEAGKILSVVSDGFVPVVTGFQAVGPDGSVVTIGRGGSDTTAVAIGAFAKAAHVDIFTDVPGVALADPRVVPDAPYMDRLDYRSMYRLASHGARVLHDKSALIGEQHNVHIRIRSTFDNGLGTLVSGDPMPPDARDVLGMATTKNGDSAVVTVVCRSGTGHRVAPLATAVAQRAGFATLKSGDPDAAAFDCTAQTAPDLVRLLFDGLVKGA